VIGTSLNNPNEKKAYLFLNDIDLKRIWERYFYLLILIGEQKTTQNEYCMYVCMYV
jgi:hypothetical protein